MHGSVTGHIAVGRFVLEIGDPSGAVVREASGAGRAHIRPRSTPVFQRPRSIPGLLGRRAELATALSALDAGLSIEVTGEPGIGKTAVLRHLAHHPRAGSFPDGIVYLTARHQSSGDLLQGIFETFYDSDACQPTEVEIRRALQDKKALILLDDVQLAQDPLEYVLEIAPRSSFVIATRDQRLWGEVRRLTLNGLAVEDAALFLEREIERPLDAAERPSAMLLCAAVGGHPLRLRQAAAIARERGIPPDGWAREIAPGDLVIELMASADDKQRRTLLALTALPGLPLPAQHVSGIADVPDVESTLMTLVRRGLVVSGQSRHRLADGVSDRLRRTEDLNPWANRAITYFTAWAERHGRSPDALLEESDTLLRAQQCAMDARRWGEALLLGRLVEGALIVGKRWGAWSTALERCLAAAKTIGDRSAEAWALHEIGTRAVCLGGTARARALLGQAASLRDELNDEAGAAASRRNLGFVLAPAFEEPRARSPLLDDPRDLDLLPLRDDILSSIPMRTTNWAGVVAIVALLIPFMGALGYWAALPDASWKSWDLASIGSLLQGGIGGAAAEPRVVRFAADPGRIEPGEQVRLCYEAVNGTRLRIDPDVGELGNLRRDCVTVSPSKTTTYMVTVRGARGQSADRTAQVLVDVAAVPEEPHAVPPYRVSDAIAGEPPPASGAPRGPAPDRASILIFTARPGSIATAGSTNLCYAVSGALRARIEPGIGEVDPADTLTCRRVAPARATTYELVASGRDGVAVRQQLVIVSR